MRVTSLLPDQANNILREPRVVDLVGQSRRNRKNSIRPGLRVPVSTQSFPVTPPSMYTNQIGVTSTSRHVESAFQPASDA